MSDPSLTPKGPLPIMTRTHGRFREDAWAEEPFTELHDDDELATNLADFDAWAHEEAEDRIRFQREHLPHRPVEEWFFSFKDNTQ